MSLYEIGDLLVRHPLAVRLILHIEATGDNKIYSADDVLGERFMRMGSLALIEATNPGHIAMPVEMEAREEAVRSLLKTAIRASPYLWTEAVRAAIKAELPRHILSPRLMPGPALWFTFETGIGIGGEGMYNGETISDAVIDAILLRDGGTQLEVVQFGEARDSNGAKRALIDGAVFRYGSVFPDDYPEKKGLMMLTSALAMLAFLNSPFIPREHARASRAARREAARAAQPVEDEVTFIMLRRPHVKPNGSVNEQTVEWKHRWLVSGHYRAQWYPKDEAHRVIWIAPYLKGPEDAPMLEHAYKVVR